jgi:hypothetical protein
LRHEDQDRQRIDETGHHRFRHIAHDEAELQQSGPDLDQTRENGCREKELQPVVADQCHHQNGGRGGRSRNHTGPSADKGD